MIDTIDYCRKYGGKRWNRKRQKPLPPELKPINPVKSMSTYRKAKLKEFADRGKPDYVDRVVVLMPVGPVVFVVPHFNRKKEK